MTQPSTGPTPAADLPEVDVAIVMESTYPYLKGGVSAVVHDIVVNSPETTFGIIHITWDRDSPHEDLYGMPSNVAWVHPVYLSMQEHREDFASLTARHLKMRAPARRAVSARLFDALEDVLVDKPEALWQLYDEGMNPRTRRYPLWALLGTKEFMAELMRRLPQLGLPLTDMFWLLREFYSLACAVLGAEIPRARVYHAHTTGYASLLSAAGARQNDGRFLLTEHNLYVRDTVNTLLDRDMAKTLKANDWRDFDVTPTQRAWMAWWIEMARFCYPSAEAITYLYPKAITEAADLGAPVEKSIVIPNGMIPADVEAAFQLRQAALARFARGETPETWRLVYIARVVPIKGLLELVATVRQLVDFGFTDFHLDVLGPTDHLPDYYDSCVARIEELGVGSHITFRGTVNVKEELGAYDLLVLSSYNEGQPIVVLEAMTAGIPTVGTEVGGMAQLVEDPLTTPEGTTWGRCGILVDPLDMTTQLAYGLAAVMSDTDLYVELAENARGRVTSFFQLSDAMAAYGKLYRELGDRPIDVPAEPEGDRRGFVHTSAALDTPIRAMADGVARTGGRHTAR